MNPIWKQRLGMGIGALVLAGGTLALTGHSLTAQASDDAQEGGAQRQIQPGQPGFGPGAPGGLGGGGFGPGGPGFGGPGGPGGPGGMMMGGGGGGAQMTATATGVYVLRGNTLYAFDPRTLKLAAKSDVPMPEPRFGPQGRPGGEGAPRPERF
jgi:hypothetical protein